MKITKLQLKQIIKEEIEAVLAPQSLLTEGKFPADSSEVDKRAANLENAAPQVKKVKPSQDVLQNLQGQMSKAFVVIDTNDNKTPPDQYRKDDLGGFQLFRALDGGQEPPSRTEYDGYKLNEPVVPVDGIIVLGAYEYMDDGSTEVHFKTVRDNRYGIYRVQAKKYRQGY